ncbi:hypothetical protein NITMOv2_0288 [Nitrospira moscoviensis]|uniref:Uncharacterized protein n=1 Tax=Nitrospira moscoviensis TaxID=42253 RepID=A0A0K2G7Y9_NITMO|nr:hypothetical protein NITMOv2_0288 [Nitrospira moscoviensis]
MLHDNIFVNGNAGQVRGCIPGLQLIKIDHKLLKLLIGEWNAEEVACAASQEFGEMPTFHVEQLLERKKKINMEGMVLGSAAGFEFLNRDHEQRDRRWRDAGDSGRLT